MASIAQPPDRPTVLYDGDCGYCRRWCELAQARTGERVVYMPYQKRPGPLRAIPTAALADAAHLVLPDGTVYRGAAAILRTLREAPRGGLGWWLYRRMPGVAPVAEAAYRWIAGHRPLMSRAVGWQDRLANRAAAHQTVAAAVMAGLGLVFLIAFVSLWVQLLGLFGPDGVVPLATALGQLRERWGGADFGRLPTVLWWGAGPGALHALCAVGTAASLVVLAGRGARPALAIAWAAYLSLVVAGEPFMSFQWDHLLLESGFAALFLQYGWGGRRALPSLAGLWWLRWLTARLMFASGAVKLGSGDEMWSGLTALAVHFETQPLPNTVAWVAHHAPGWLLAAGTAATLAIELGLPLLVFLGRRARALAALGFLVLQAAIVVTGNYGFFNLLSAVLCLSLLDDGQLRRPGNRLWRRRANGDEPRAAAVPAVGAHGPEAVALPGRGLGRAVVAAVLVLASLAPTLQAANVTVPTPFAGLHDTVAPWRLVNGYGLFARMTTSRPELIFEATADGTTWRELDFRYKPDDPGERPFQIAPHMPRLDWQLWFAALGDPRRNPWVFHTMAQLCRQSEPVRGLFGPDPLAGRPPQELRAVRYLYRFSTPDERAAQHVWWTRERLGIYGGPIRCDAARGLSRG